MPDMYFGLLIENSVINDAILNDGGDLEFSKEVIFGSLES